MAHCAVQGLVEYTNTHCLVQFTNCTYISKYGSYNKQCMVHISINSEWYTFHRSLLTIHSAWYTFHKEQCNSHYKIYWCDNSNNSCTDLLQQQHDLWQQQQQLCWPSTTAVVKSSTKVCTISASPTFTLALPGSCCHYFLVFTRQRPCIWRGEVCISGTGSRWDGSTCCGFFLIQTSVMAWHYSCLLYTSDAADE